MRKEDCIALIGLVIVGYRGYFVLLYLLPFEVRGDGKHVGRYRHIDYLGERSGLPQGAHSPKGVETKLKFLFIVA